MAAWGGAAMLVPWNNISATSTLLLVVRRPVRGMRVVISENPQRVSGSALMAPASNPATLGPWQETRKESP
jgi:hypothetical protein